MKRRHLYFNMFDSCMFSTEQTVSSHQSRHELLLHQRDEGQAVGSLLGRQIIVCVVFLKNTDEKFVGEAAAADTEREQNGPRPPFLLESFRLHPFLGL